MAINLHSKFEKKLVEAFKVGSITNGRFTDAYSFVGNKTVKLTTAQTVALGDYTRSGDNRYGTPTEVQDIVQELTMTKDRSFALTVDKGNDVEQDGIKAAGKILALQVKERCIPELDLYALTTIAYNGGKIVATDTALSKSNIGDRIGVGVAYLDDAEVPDDGRTLYVTSTAYNYLSKNSDIVALEKAGTDAVIKGVVGEYNGIPVVKVPAGRMPANVNFILAHRDSACVPVKINETKLHIDPPGLSGNLLEGRMNYDTFVIGTKCDGIFVDVQTAANKTASPAISAAGAITFSAGACYYTIDGTDPRYSPTRKTATTGDDAGGVGTVVKAYQVATGKFPSDVVTVTVSA